MNVPIPPTENSNLNNPTRILTNIVLFENFLNEMECKALIDMARPHLQRSTTVSSNNTTFSVHPSRTSDGMFFRIAQNQLIQDIESKISNIFNWPVNKTEGIQVLRYKKGDQYKPHYDYFNLDNPNTPNITKKGGQRVGTLIIYLNTPDYGGNTNFPDIGLEVKAIRGNAVFFNYDKPLSKNLTLHGGSPVGSGEKWIATKWFRSSIY
jgi:prolyl 4-hydroxylase